MEKKDKINDISWAIQKNCFQLKNVYDEMNISMFLLKKYMFDVTLLTMSGNYLLARKIMSLKQTQTYNNGP